MQLITKDQFEDILFNPNISVSEKRSFKRSSILDKKQTSVKLVSNGIILAIFEMTPEGGFYYKTGE